MEFKRDTNVRGGLCRLGKCGRERAILASIRLSDDADLMQVRVLVLDRCGSPMYLNLVSRES